jgi:hypothetical protein
MWGKLVGHTASAHDAYKRWYHINVSAYTHEMTHKRTTEVEARYEDSETWFEGTVASVDQKHCTYEIEFIDGDVQHGVQGALIWDPNSHELEDEPGCGCRCCRPWVPARIETAGGEKLLTEHLASGRLVWGERPTAAHGVLGGLHYDNRIGDAAQFVYSWHPLLGSFLAPETHPYTRRERRYAAAVAYCVALALGVDHTSTYPGPTEWGALVQCAITVAVVHVLFKYCILKGCLKGVSEQWVLRHHKRHFVYQAAANRMLAITRCTCAPLVVWSALVVYFRTTDCVPRSGWVGPLDHLEQPAGSCPAGMDLCGRADGLDLPRYTHFRLEVLDTHSPDYWVIAALTLFDHNGAAIPTPVSAAANASAFSVGDASHAGPANAFNKQTVAADCRSDVGSGVFPGDQEQCERAVGRSFYASAQTVTSGWLQFRFGQPRAVTGYSLTNVEGFGTAWMPRSFILTACDGSVNATACEGDTTDKMPPNGKSHGTQGSYGSYGSNAGATAATGTVGATGTGTGAGDESPGTGTSALGLCPAGDSEAQLLTDSNGAVRSCAEGQAAGYCTGDAALVLPAGQRAALPAGANWFAPRCCATCGIGGADATSPWVLLHHQPEVASWSSGGSKRNEVTYEGLAPVPCNRWDNHLMREQYMAESCTGQCMRKQALQFEDPQAAVGFALAVIALWWLAVWPVAAAAVFKIQHAMQLATMAGDPRIFADGRMLSRKAKMRREAKDEAERVREAALSPSEAAREKEKAAELGCAEALLKKCLDGSGQILTGADMRSGVTGQIKPKEVLAGETAAEAQARYYADKRAGEEADAAAAAAADEAKKALQYALTKQVAVQSGLRRAMVAQREKILVSKEQTANRVSAFRQKRAAAAAVAAAAAAAAVAAAAAAAAAAAEAARALERLQKEAKAKEGKGVGGMLKRARRASVVMMMEIGKALHLLPGHIPGTSVAPEGENPPPDEGSGVATASESGFTEL